jgi:hypothetical protein
MLKTEGSPACFAWHCEDSLFTSQDSPLGFQYQQLTDGPFLHAHLYLASVSNKTGVLLSLGFSLNKKD